MFRYLALLFLAPSTASAETSQIDAYITCLRAMTSVYSYVYIVEEEEGKPLPARIKAALDADLEFFMAFGVDKFGQASVETMIEEGAAPDEVLVQSAMAIRKAKGSEAGLNAIADSASPCGGASGQLKAVLAVD